MRIGINLLFLKPKLAGGTETYTYGLLSGLANIASGKNTFFIFCSYDLELAFLNDKPEFNIIKFSIGTSVAYRCFFEQFIFPFRLKKHRLDVLHSFGYIGPVLQKNHLVTIHDTNAFAHEDMDFTRRFFLSYLMKLTAKNCTQVIAVSSFSKKEIVKHLKILPDKISVVYEACKYSALKETQPLPAQYNFLMNEPYFVALSSVSKNKNIETLINAFEIALKKNMQAKLVLIGYLPEDNSIQKSINSKLLQDKIITTQYVDDDTLVALFQHSTGFIFPSLYEGFGLPLLEAQALGSPVIASDKGSLPEVGESSVLYFDGTDTNALADAMIDLSKDKNLRLKYINAGYENIKRFSWNSAAQQVFDLYFNVYSHAN